jgi:hypothetical protein
MSSRIPPRLVLEVRARAAKVCEYCLLPQITQEATFHIDHVIPVSRNGATAPNNLALACVTCSLRKAARVRVRDPQSDRLVALFNPRVDNWDEHFAITKQMRIRGRTATGRATIDALKMNRFDVIAIRRALVLLGNFPPTRG